MLPQGEAQTWPAGIEAYIDDFSGRALQDTVNVPEHLRDIPIGDHNTAAVGADPARNDSRLAVHCRIAIHELRQLGAEVPDDKTMCGSGMVVLGVQLDASAQHIRCPELKRAWLLHTVDAMSSQLSKSSSIQMPVITKLTGRLTNLSQFFPELRKPLAVGYALSRVRWRVSKGGARWPVTTLHLRRGHRRYHELRELLATVAYIMRLDSGVSMAPPLRFPSPSSHGVLTIVTDASRADSDDGLGGYAFSPGLQGIVFIMSEAWPDDIKAALEAAAVTRSERERTTLDHGGGRVSRLSMPAAETLAAIALATAVHTVLGGGTSAVVAVIDCAPAAAALSALYSAAPQIRHLIGAAAAISTRWLGVAVPREANTHADTLSHPSRKGEIHSLFREKGFQTRELAVPAQIWKLASQAATLPLRVEDGEADMLEIHAMPLPTSHLALTRS